MCDCKSFDECVCSVSTSCCCLSLLLLLLLLLGRLVSLSGHVLGEGSAGCQGVAESYLDSKSGGSLRGMGKGGEGEEVSISKSNPNNPNNPVMVCFDWKQQAKGLTGFALDAYNLS